MSDVPLVVGDVARWYALTSLALGLRTGLGDALLAGGGTVDELAAAAGVDRRNAEVWAGAMIASGYARAEGDRVVAIDDAIGVLRGGLPFDFRAAVEVLAPMGALLPEVERAIRDGGGIRSHDIQATLGSLPERVNGPMYERFLIEDWIGAFPELDGALRAGMDVAEIGPGGGAALLILAGAFPRSRFIGFDIDPAQVARANATASAAGCPNATFRALDAADMPSDSFDLVCIFDAFHHLGWPDIVLDAIHRALRPAGSLLIAETSLSGDPMTDSEEPLSPITYGCDLIYCFQESKADGGMGLGATWAPLHLERFLGEHGFAIASVHASDAGYRVTRAQPRVEGGRNVRAEATA